MFVPTPECRRAGQVISTRIASRWAPPSYLYQFRRGGHVAALRDHLSNTCFARLDLADFFGSINRTRVTRVLKSMLAYDDARKWAKLSVVTDPEHSARWMLPFGFVQSPIIAALAFSRSALGTSIKRIRKRENVTLTCYVDDIIISSTSAALVEAALADISDAVTRSAFGLNKRKCEGPASEITAFNIRLSHKSILISQTRMEQFRSVISESDSIAKVQGIKAYVASVNHAQVRDL